MDRCQTAQWSVGWKSNQAGNLTKAPLGAAHCSSRNKNHNTWQLSRDLGCGLYVVHPKLSSSFTLCVLHFSIFTATFVLDWAWARPYAVASTTLPKAPDPRVRPETQRRAQYKSLKWRREYCKQFLLISQESRDWNKKMITDEGIMFPAESSWPPETRHLKQTFIKSRWEYGQDCLQNLIQYSSLNYTQTSRVPHRPEVTCRNLQTN